MFLWVVGHLAFFGKNSAHKNSIDPIKLNSMWKDYRFYSIEKKNMEGPKIRSFRRPSNAIWESYMSGMICCRLFSVSWWWLDYYPDLREVIITIWIFHSRLTVKKIAIKKIQENWKYQDQNRFILHWIMNSTVLIEKKMTSKLKYILGNFHNSSLINIQ